MNIITRGLGKLSKIITRGFGKTITIIVKPLIKPLEGGGGFVELPPLKHPFELIDTKAINVPIKKIEIIVKVSFIELEVKVKYSFVKYNKINIIFRGIEE